MNVGGAPNIISARHYQMIQAALKISPELLDRSCCDPFIGRWPESFDDRSKLNAPEIAFGLCFPKRIAENGLAIDEFAVVSKGCCRELEDRTL
jgi:hypothetical protein